MAVQITIRDVPDTVRKELAARAASQGRSMQEYLLAELRRLATKPSLERVLAQARQRKGRTGTTLTAAELLGHRDADRR